MTPIFDVRTMVFVYVGIRIGQAIVLIYLWSVQRNYPPAKEWAIGALLTAIGLFLLALRNMAPLFITNIASNALLMPGMMIFDFGIARAAGRQPPYKLGLFFCTLALGSMAWYSYTFPDYYAQVNTQNLLFMSFDIYAAYACFTVNDSRRTMTFRMIGILLVILILAGIWRSAGGVFGMTFTLSQTLPRIVYISTSVIIFPMVTMLLTLHTSQRLQEEINEQALHDMLTGAYNRRAFDDLANREWSRTIRHGYPFSFLTVDIDHFKQFNDLYGHQTGDATLVQVSNSAQTALRSNDIWCRYGGEEFIALLPNTTLEQAIAVAERLRTEVEKTMIHTPRGLLKVSVSIGVAERSALQSHWGEVLAASDAALYQAKAAGRNRVVAGGNASAVAAG